MDPAGYVDGMSLYQYVTSNPLKYWDPFGLCLEALANAYYRSWLGPVLSGTKVGSAVEFSIGVTMTAADEAVAIGKGIANAVNPEPQDLIRAATAISNGAVDRATHLKGGATPSFGEVLNAGIENSLGITNMVEGYITTTTGQNSYGEKGSVLEGIGQASLGLSQYTGVALVITSPVSGTRAFAGRAGRGAATASRGAPTRVLHFTDDVGREAISKSGNLRQGSFVTLPREMPVGSTARQVENFFEIAPGRGRNFIDMFIDPKDLVVPGPKNGGLFTSGGARQFQLRRELSIDPRRFGKTEQ